MQLSNLPLTFYQTPKFLAIPHTCSILFHLHCPLQNTIVPFCILVLQTQMKYTSSVSALITAAKHMSILNSFNPLSVRLRWDSTLSVYYYAHVLFSQLKCKVVNSRIQGFSNICVSNNAQSRLVSDFSKVPAS